MRERGCKNRQEQTCHVRKKGIEAVIEELNQRVKETAAKIGNYEK